MGKKEDNNKLNIKNKKAYFLYEIIEKFVAGIELYGTEIKSIRQGKASINDAYCKFMDNELWVLMSISEYSHGGVYNHEPDRRRKLLLTKKELKKLNRKVEENGFTIVPLSLFLNENGMAKLEIALAKGKKVYDRREDIKERDAKREISRNTKYRF